MSPFINEELVQERIEALEAFINSFPDSPLVPIMKNEINYLNNALDGKTTV